MLLLSFQVGRPSAAVVLAKVLSRRRAPGLLADVRSVLDVREVGRIGSADLCTGLNTFEDAPWAGFHGGQGINPRALSGMLGAYEIKPGSVRLPNGTTPKGYRREQFTDAWSRYLTGYCAPGPSYSASDAPHRHNGAPPTIFGDRQAPEGHGGSDRATSESPHGLCHVADVADGRPQDASQHEEDWRELVPEGLDPEHPFGVERP